MNHEGTHPARDPAGQAWTRGAAQGQAGSHTGRLSLLLPCFGARLRSSLAPRACLRISGSGFTFLAERRKARKITPSKAPVLSSAPDLSAGRGKALPPPPPFHQRVRGHQGRTRPSGCRHPPHHQRRGAGDTVPLLVLSPGRSLRPRPGREPCPAGTGRWRGTILPCPAGVFQHGPVFGSPFPRGPPATRVRATEDT